MRLKIFLIYEIIEVKSNTKLNRLAEMKTKDSIIFLNLILFYKLSKIFILIILINYKLKQEIESR